MNGVPIPCVSAGSNHGASETWTPSHLASGAASLGAGSVAAIPR